MMIEIPTVGALVIRNNLCAGIFEKYLIKHAQDGLFKLNLVDRKNKLTSSLTEDKLKYFKRFWSN